jgi:coproporphyrinogen III oxidase
MKTSTDYCQFLIFFDRKEKRGVGGFTHNTELSFQNKFKRYKELGVTYSCDPILHVISLAKCTRRRLKAHTMLSKSSSSISDLLPFRFISKSTPS